MTKKREVDQEIAVLRRVAGQIGGDGLDDKQAKHNLHGALHG